MKTYYAAIRKPDDGKEFIDTSTITQSRTVTELTAQEDDLTIPNYAAANPVVRVAKIEIRERLS